MREWSLALDAIEVLMQRMADLEPTFCVLLKRERLCRLKGLIEARAGIA